MGNMAKEFIKQDKVVIFKTPSKVKVEDDCMVTSVPFGSPDPDRGDPKQTFDYNAKPAIKAGHTTKKKERSKKEIESMTKDLGSIKLGEPVNYQTLRNLSVETQIEYFEDIFDRYKGLSKTILKEYLSAPSEWYIDNWLYELGLPSPKADRAKCKTLRKTMGLVEVDKLIWNQFKGLPPKDQKRTVEKLIQNGDEPNEKFGIADITWKRYVKANKFLQPEPSSPPEETVSNYEEPEAIEDNSNKNTKLEAGSYKNLNMESSFDVTNVDGEYTLTLKISKISKNEVMRFISRFTDNPGYIFE